MINLARGDVVWYVRGYQLINMLRYGTLINYENN